MSFDETDTPKSPRTRRAVATALVMGLAALTAQATESELVHDIQRYCAVCWRVACLPSATVSCSSPMG